MIKANCPAFLIFILLLFNTGISQTPGSATPKPTATSITASYVFPSGDKRRKRFLNDTFGLGALAGTVIGAGFEQIDNQPPEWKKTGNGFARRIASNFGRNAIEQSSLYGLSEVFGQDQEYRKCDCRGFSRRTIYALRSGFTARNRKGDTVFSPPKVVSPFVSHIASVKLWYPSRFNVRDGARQGGYSLMFNTGFNLVKEFIFKKK
ncbi:hypothetical protein BH10ACI2_BH10ACI2_20340 [soil metagenome]